MQKLLFILYLLPLLAGTPVGATVLIGDSEDTPAHAPRVALVIGNAGYPNAPLLTPLNDARTIGNVLRTAGFEVIGLENATLSEIKRALGTMSRRLGTDGTALFYFSGHGARISGASFILPVDADNTTADTVATTALDVNSILRHMSYRRAGQPNIIILDACLDNPFAITESGNNIVMPASSDPLPAQTLIAYAATPGGVAYDGNGQHGLFTRAFLDTGTVKGMSLTETFAQVQTTVRKTTHGRQSPWTVSTLDTGRFPMPRLVDNNSAGFDRLPPLDDEQLDTMKTRGILPKDGDAKYELEFWQSIRDSTDAADFNAYLEAYPNGKFAPLAKSRAKRYSKTPEKPAPKTTANPVPSQPTYSVTDMDEKYDVLSNANIRQQPSPRSARLGVLRKGTHVQVTGRVSGQNWYRINSGGISGFVYGNLINKRPAPIVKTAPPKTPASKTVSESASFQDCPSCPEMLALPAGTFIMGNNRGDSSERPAHRVSIKQPFSIGKYEVTLGQWNACVKAGGCHNKPELNNMDENLPARNLSWTDARAYVAWLGKLTGQAYRLPTEAEWEYAARAGTETLFWWGNAVGSGHANCKGCGGQWDRKSPAEVNSYSANPFGLHGTSGGVWEWVADCWHKSYKGAPRDGSSWSKPDCRENVIRGGSWRNDSSYIHSASRFKYDASVQYLLHGFRVAKTLQ